MNSRRLLSSTGLLPHFGPSATAMTISPPTAPALPAGNYVEGGGDRLVTPVLSPCRKNQPALREGDQRLRRVARCNVEIYSTKAEIRRRTIASFHSFDTQSRDSGLIISCIYRSPHTGISRVPWTNLSTLPSITSWTRKMGKTPLFASESLVKSDGGELSDFATGPSPFPDTPWQEAQDRRNSFRPGFSSGCACRASIVPIIVEAANKATHHVVRISLHPLRVCPFNFAPAHCQEP